jgi:hypothetical protein
MTCFVTWGGAYHVCDLVDGHEGVHMCTCTSTYNSETGDECE